jgi:hypothetical protein
MWALREDGMRVLVTGWFSLDVGHATAGDVMAHQVVCEWLDEAGYAYDVAVTPPFVGDLGLAAADPSKYSHVVFVCGPFRPGWPLTEFLERFAGCTLIGINVSMLQPVEMWNPFDALLERDGTRTSRPDLAFLSTQPQVPVVGVVLVHPQSEYGDRQRHAVVNEAVRCLMAARDVAVVNIDTRLDTNAVGLSSPGQVEALIARMDAVVTTRLHGLVLALKNGVPAVAIDPIAGGAKIKQQADRVGWPIVFTPESLSDEALGDAYDYCLTPTARELAIRCRNDATESIRTMRLPFLAALSEPSQARGNGPRR